MKKLFIMAMLLLSMSAVFAGGSSESTESLPIEPEGVSARISQGSMDVIGGYADSIADSFMTTFIGGHQRLRGNPSGIEYKVGIAPSLSSIISAIFKGCLILELLLIGLSLMTQNLDGITGAQIAWKIVSIFFLLAIIINLGYIVDFLSKLFTRAGFFAGTGVIDTRNTSIRPSAVTDFYTATMTPLDEYADTYDRITDTLLGMMDMSVMNIDTWLIPWIGVQLDKALLSVGLAVIKFIITVLFIFVLIEVTITICELWLLVAVATLMLPFKLFKYTKFMGDGVFPALFGQCIKLFVIAFILSSAGDVFEAVMPDTIAAFNEAIRNWNLSNQQSMDAATISGVLLSLPTIWGILPSIIFVTLLFVYFILKGPAIAKALIVGQPTMDTHGSHTVKVLGTAALTASFHGLRTVISNLRGFGSAGAAGAAGGGMPSVNVPITDQPKLPPKSGLNNPNLPM